MFAMAQCEFFVLQNGLLQRYPDKLVKIYYGLSSFLATSSQPEHAIVLDAAMAFKGLDPEPPSSIGDNIDWVAIDQYLKTPVKKLPKYRRIRFDPVANVLEAAASDDKHALSAMLSNFTPASRLEVRKHVIAFLLDPKMKKFELPAHLQPKRGRAVAYYEAANKADYSAIKAEIALAKPNTYEARYWSKVIAREAANR